MAANTSVGPVGYGGLRGSATSAKEERPGNGGLQIVAFSWALWSGESTKTNATVVKCPEPLLLLLKK